MSSLSSKHHARDRRKPRVIFWADSPTPYMVGRFNVIAQRDNLAFEAWFTSKREPDRQWKVDENNWNFPARYVTPTRRDLLASRTLVTALKNSRPDLLITGYSRATYILGSMIAKALGSRVAHRVVPNYEALTYTAHWKQLIKHFLFRAADGAKVPGDHARIVARHYGFPSERICQVTQSVDVEHYSRALHVDPITRTVQRQALGLGGCVFLYAGRLVKGKGLDHLLSAYRQLRSEGCDISLMLIGDGADAARYRDLCLKNYPRVVFTGFLEPDDLPAYYALGDVFVCPSLGDVHGLAVNEAMAAGLPVIASSAMSDIQCRVVDGESGYIVAPSDPAGLAGRMRIYVNDLSAAKRHAVRARQIIAKYTHDRYARDLERFVHHVLSLPRRRSISSYFDSAAGRIAIISDQLRSRLQAFRLQQVEVHKLRDE